MPSPEEPSPLPTPEALAPSRSRFQWLRPSHTHTAFSATLLLMTSSLLSGGMGLVRSKYIAYIFGAGRLTDAYNAAFEMPDMISYFLVGGVA
ncbi:MAG: virulence factor MviN, partial [Edaphobacter sp.]